MSGTNLYINYKPRGEVLVGDTNPVYVPDSAPGDVIGSAVGGQMDEADLSGFCSLFKDRTAAHLAREAKNKAFETAEDRATRMNFEKGKLEALKRNKLDARKARHIALKLAKESAQRKAAFDKELARESNEKYFTRGPEHLAAVKRQEECEAALIRYRAGKRASASTRRIVGADVVNRDDEAMAMEALAPIQRPLGPKLRRVHGDCNKENWVPFVEIEMEEVGQPWNGII